MKMNKKEFIMINEDKWFEELLAEEAETFEQWLERTEREEKALKTKVNSFEGLLANQQNKEVENYGEYVIPMGKYTGRKLKSFKIERLEGYLSFMRENHSDKAHWEPVLEAMRGYIADYREKNIDVPFFD